jgi:hypothetical protein
MRPMFEPHPFFHEAPASCQQLRQQKLASHGSPGGTVAAVTPQRVGKQSTRCRPIYCAFGHNCSGRRAACEPKSSQPTRLPLQKAQANSLESHRFQDLRKLSRAGSRSTNDGEGKLRAPRELASFFASSRIRNSSLPLRTREGGWTRPWRRSRPGRRRRRHCWCRRHSWRRRHSRRWRRCRLRAVEDFRQGCRDASAIVAASKPDVGGAVGVGWEVATRIYERRNRRTCCPGISARIIDVHLIRRIGSGSAAAHD